MVVLERDAGFYTTRYGRSDPMMRFKEAQTRFFPEPLPADPQPKLMAMEAEGKKVLLTLPKSINLLRFSHNM